MTRHFPDLNSASDWLKQISHAARPIRGTTKIWKFLRSFLRCHFVGKPRVMASPNVRYFLRLRSSQWFLNSVSYEVPSCVNNLHLLACHFYFGKNINGVKPFKIFSRNISKSSWCICQHWRRHGIRILTAFVFQNFALFLWKKVFLF